MIDGHHGMGPRIAGLARLLVAAPFYLLGLTTMSTSVAARGLIVGVVAGLMLAGVAAQAAAGPLPAVGYLGVGLLVGTLGFVGFVGRARRILRARSRVQPAALLLSAREPTADDERRAAGVLARLARQVDLVPPELRVVDDEGPVCFTLEYPESEPPAGVIEDALGVRLRRERARTGERTGPTPAAFADPVEADRVVVVSTGLLSTLSAAEQEAVLAHELAHVRNGDLRLMNWLLVPVGWSESVLAAAREESDRGRTVLAALRGGAKLFAYGATVPGVAAFTRGRDLQVPGMQSGPLNYAVYPHVEVDGKEHEDVTQVFRFAPSKP